MGRRRPGPGGVLVRLYVQVVCCMLLSSYRSVGHGYGVSQLVIISKVNKNDLGKGG